MIGLLWRRTAVAMPTVLSGLALTLGLCLAVTACSDSSTTTQSDLPGTEEFGLSKQQLVEKVTTVEALIANCMRDAGFEYIPVDYNTVRHGMVADKSLPGLSERAYAEQHGFGISTLYTGHAPQLDENPTPAQIGLGAQNIQIFRGLSPPDQTAYNQTLLGKNTAATFAVSLETEDFSRTGGCTRSAIDRVFTPEQLSVTYRNPKDALIEQDPRMAAAIAAFSDCLRTAGFDYNHEPDIEPDLRDRLWAVTEGAPLEALSPEARDNLAALQSYERDLAIATLDCEQRHLEPVEDQVERELYARRDQQ